MQMSIIEADPAIRRRTNSSYRILPRAWHYTTGDTIRLFGDNQQHTIIKPVWAKERHLLLSTGIIISHDTPVDIGALPYEVWWKNLHEEKHGISQ